MYELRVRLGRFADPRPWPVDEVWVDGEDAVVLDRRDDRPALSGRDVTGLRGIRVRGEDDDLRVASQDLFGRELRVRRRRARGDVHATGDVDEIVDVRAWADREDLRRIRRVDLVIHARPNGRARGLRLDGVDPLLDRAPESFAVGADRFSEQRRGLRDVGHALRIHDEHVERRRLKLLDRAVGELHAEDKIRLQRDDLLEVHLDPADVLPGRGLGWLVREIVDADDAGTRAESEEKRGDGWADGHKTLRAHRNGDRPVLEIAEGRRKRRCGRSEEH